MCAIGDENPHIPRVDIEDASFETLYALYTTGQMENPEGWLYEQLATRPGFRAWYDARMKAEGR
jgi:hypothetical protein